MIDRIDSDLANSAKTYWHEQGWSEGGVIREVDYGPQARGLDPIFEGIKIVDCDTHFTEPKDLFTSRAPAGLKHKVPHVVSVNGVDRWRVGDRDFGSMGGNVIRNDNNKLLGRLAYPREEDAHRGGSNVKPRLQAMDDMGVYAQICFHNSGVTQAGSLMSLADDELALSVISIYNDAAAERQEESGQRLFTLAQLPIWNKEALEKEARRAIDMGLKGFVLPDLPENLGVPGFCDDYWTPFLEMCAESGLPLNFHLNSGMKADLLAWHSFDFERRLAIAAMMQHIGNAATLGNWMLSGRLDQFPKLKIGLIESGISWVPFVLEAMEHQFDEMLAGKADEFERRPKEYFRDQFWCSFWFETLGPKKLLEDIGVDKVLFETDFPHPTSLYPGVQDHLKDVLGGHDYATRKKVLQTNAVTLYNLPF